MAPIGGRPRNSSSIERLFRGRAFDATWAESHASRNFPVKKFLRFFSWLAVSAIGAGAALAEPASGRIVAYPRFQSQFVAPREVDVWLPPGYDATPGARYPVIYMQDGQNLFDPAKSYTGVAWGVDRAIDRMIEAGRTQGAVIVGIWNTGLTRSAEYMPEKAVSIRDIKEVPNSYGPVSHPIISDLYLKFMVRELKPFVDRTFRTQADAAHTFAMGSSMGALISAYAVVEYPRVFGGAACLSTHWPAGDGAVIDYLGAHLPDPATHRFYFDHGTETLDSHYAPFQERMDEVMKAHGYREGVSWVSRVFPGADHSESSWSRRVEIPLGFLLGAKG
jgi:predicted alpha/beta superfamily hydrolase